MANGEETGWCIEGYGLYWNGGECDGFGVIGDAVRFARREDAERVVRFLLRTIKDRLVVADHMWCPGPE